jgi:fatty-acid desaturase
MGLLHSRTATSTLRIPTVIVISAVHLGALLAPFTFSWTGLVLCVTLYLITGGVGVTACYHRLLTHKSFKTYRPVKWFMTLCGCLALEGGPISWVASHRLHHKESDQTPDPHSPLINFLWSHMLWLFWSTPGVANPEEERQWTRDLHRDKMMLFFQKAFFPINLAVAAALYGIGWAIAGPAFGLSLFIWGFCLRIVLVWHATWLVNSATHMWGYQNYVSGDNSRNTWWVALLTFGEGWHNNHHADQVSAAHGHRWFEFDPTYAFIRLMERFKLAWDVVEPRRTHRITAIKDAA